MFYATPNDSCRGSWRSRTLVPGNCGWALSFVGRQTCSAESGGTLRALRGRSVAGVERALLHLRGMVVAPESRAALAIWLILAAGLSRIIRGRLEDARAGANVQRTELRSLRSIVDRWCATKPLAVTP
jgi:hypothetical protein